MLTLVTKGFIAKDIDGSIYVYKDEPKRDKYGYYDGELIARIYSDELDPLTPRDADPIECEISLILTPKSHV